MSKYIDIHINLDQDVDFHGTLRLAVPIADVGIVADALRAGRFKLRYEIVETKTVQL